jgi:hypothetical protein
LRACGDSRGWPAAARRLPRSQAPLQDRAPGAGMDLGPAAIQESDRNSADLVGRAGGFEPILLAGRKFLRSEAAHFGTAAGTGGIVQTLVAAAEPGGIARSATAFQLPG